MRWIGSSHVPPCLCLYEVMMKIWRRVGSMVVFGITLIELSYII
jgi:hypothetical protein